jgi:hypothetical protein
VGTEGQVLQIVSSVPAWATFSALTNPMTTVGDLIVGGASGAPTRLAAGTAGYVLTSGGAGVAPSWSATGTTTYTINWTTGAATNGNGTATITSASVVTLSIGAGVTAGYASGTYTAPRVRVPMPTGVVASRFRVTLRLASFSGKTGGTTPCVTLENTGSAASKYGMYYAGTTIGSQNFVTAAAITSGTPASPPLYDGNDWTQLTADGGTLVFAFARGTGGARPSDSDFRSCGAVFAYSPFDTKGWDLVVLMAQNPSAGGTVTMTFDNCTVEAL